MRAMDVASWLGNSVPVAMKHYAMATDEAFVSASAAKGSTATRSTRPTHQPGGGNGRGIRGYRGAIRREPEEGAKSKNPLKKGPLIVKDSGGNFWKIGLEGLEPPTKGL